MLVGGAGFGLFVACGGEEDSCTFDADCGDGQACEGTVCVETCTSDADCLAGEVCGEGVNTQLDVCKSDTDTNNGGTTNNTTGTNNVNNGTTLLYVARIQSTSSGDEACAVSDPGPDIFGVGLEDTTGAQLGWGEIAWEEVQFDDNDYTDTSVIDGNGPDLAADTCPDEFSDSVVSLGCDAASYIIVGFVGSDGNPIALDAAAGQVIRVYEWGGQCSTGSVADTYNLDICRDTDAAKGGDDSSCDINLLLDAAGEQSGDVSGF